MNFLSYAIIFELTFIIISLISINILINKISSQPKLSQKRIDNLKFQILNNMKFSISSNYFRIKNTTPKIRVPDKKPTPTRASIKPVFK